MTSGTLWNLAGTLHLTIAEGTVNTLSGQPALSGVRLIDGGGKINLRTTSEWSTSFSASGVTIGGDVSLDARGTNHCAAINGSNITITDNAVVYAAVSANGASYPAAIGGTVDQGASNIHLSGNATVTVYGGVYGGSLIHACGIGCGARNDGWPSSSNLTVSDNVRLYIARGARPFSSTPAITGGSYNPSAYAESWSYATTAERGITEVSQIPNRGRVLNYAMQTSTADEPYGYVVVENVGADAEAGYTLRVVPVRKVAECSVSPNNTDGLDSIVYDSDCLHAEDFEGLPAGTGDEDLTYEYRKLDPETGKPLGTGGWLTGTPTYVGTYEVRMWTSRGGATEGAGSFLLYDETPIQTTVEISKAPLTVTAADQHVVFNADLPSLDEPDDYTIEGVQPNDEGMVYEGEPELSWQDGVYEKGVTPPGTYEGAIEVDCGDPAQEGLHLIEGAPDVSRPEYAPTANYYFVEPFTEGDLAVYRSAAYGEGGVPQTDFVYGDTITVQGSVNATGEASGDGGAASALSVATDAESDGAPSGDAGAKNATPVANAASFTEPGEGQAALFYGDTQISEPADVDDAGYFRLSYDTEAKLVSAEGSGSEVELEIRFTGNDSIDATEVPLAVTLSPKPITATLSGTASKTYDGKDAYPYYVEPVFDPETDEDITPPAVPGEDDTMEVSVDAAVLETGLDDSAVDDVTASCEAIAYDDWTAGTKSLTATGVSISGTDAAWYTVADEAHATLDEGGIVPAPLTVTANAPSYNGQQNALAYNSAPPTNLGVTVEGWLSSPKPLDPGEEAPETPEYVDDSEKWLSVLTGALSYATDYQKGDAAGDSYTIDVSWTNGLIPAELSNYEIAITDADFTVVGAAYTRLVDHGLGTRTYNGQAIDRAAVEEKTRVLDAGGAEGTGTFEFVWERNDGGWKEIDYDPVDVGQYRMRVLGGADANHVDLTGNGLVVTFNINQAAVTVRASDVTVGFGGALPDISAPVEGEDYTVSGIIDGDDAHLEGAPR